MSKSKYGIERDPYCYPGTTTLINRPALRDDDALMEAERHLTATAAETIDFALPPYDLTCLRSIHRHLFGELYLWAGDLRSVDISKDATRFCTATRIQPEAIKLFNALADLDWLQGMRRHDLVRHVAEFFGDLNVLHPFREGNGRAQRILF